MDTHQINDIARFIKRKFSPQKVILFGSHAYGNPTSESDVDLLVIMDTPLKFYEQAAIIRLALDEAFNISFSMDIIVRNQKELEKRIELNDFFIRDIVEKGISL